MINRWLARISSQPFSFLVNDMNKLKKALGIIVCTAFMISHIAITTTLIGSGILAENTDTFYNNTMYMIWLLIGGLNAYFLIDFVIEYWLCKFNTAAMTDFKDYK